MVEAMVAEPVIECCLQEPSKCIDHFMPQIFWHDRKQIMSLHIQQQAFDGEYVSDEAKNCDMRYKLCTVSVQHEVRVWELIFSKSKSPKLNNHRELGVNFVANLVGHMFPLNVVQYSPNGQLISSGDVDGKLYIWKIQPRDENLVPVDEGPLNEEAAQFDIPPNKENWVRACVPISHDSDLNALAFSTNSNYICTAAADNLRLIDATSGKQKWNNRNFRRLINGLAWDPQNKYIVCMSSDRRLDLVDANRGLGIRTCYSHNIPETIIDGKTFKEGVYKFFFDQHVYALTRSPEFSPCGELFVAPAGQLENSEVSVYGSYLFLRSNFDKCLPHAFYPSPKPTLMVRFSPVKHELRQDTDQNLSALPYRWIFAVMCPESIYFFDTQTEFPIGYAYDLSYDNLTSISWSPDGKILAISSLEGFNTFLHVHTNDLVPSQLTIHKAQSPPLKKAREPRPEKPEFGEAKKA